MALLAARNTGDTGSTNIGNDSWLATGGLIIATSGNVSSVKVKGYGLTSTGTGNLKARLKRGDDVLGQGQIDITTIPDIPAPADWYTISISGSPQIIASETLVLELNAEVNSGVVIFWWTNQVGSRYTELLEIHGTELSAPTKATNPVPTDANTSVTLDQATIGWTDGGGADTFNIYYGIQSGNLTKVSDAQAGVSFTITDITSGSPFDYLVVRYWRIDSTNAAGTTTGDEWIFTTIRADAPKVTYWYNNQYYQLLIQDDGTYGDHPADGGVEDTDYVFLVAGYEPNAIRTNIALVAVANSKVWYEDIT